MESCTFFSFILIYYVHGDKQLQVILHRITIISVQLLSHVQLFVTPWTAAHQASLSITSSWSLLKIMSIESVMSSSHLILCHPLLHLPQIFPSIRIFSSESVLCIRWPEYWSFSFRISPSNEYSGLISFRIDWLGLLAVQGTLKYSPTPQFESIYSSVLSFLYSPNLCEMLSQHPYVTTGKIIALSRWTFVSKVMSLLFSYVTQLVHDQARDQCMIRHMISV